MFKQRFVTFDKILT